MDPFTLALIGGGSSLISGGLGYMGSQRAGRAQQQAAQTSGLFNLIAQQQAIAAQQEAARKGVGALEAAETRGAEALRSGETRGAEALRTGEAQARADMLDQLRRSEEAQREFYGRGVGFQQPYMRAGEGATNQLAALFAPGGEYTRQPTQAELEMDPGYAFRFREGQRALEQSAAARGGLLSGGAGKALARYGQEAGSQEYQNAYARFMANRAAATQGLQNLMGTGAGAAQTATGLAGQAGANLGQSALTAGQNLAAGARSTAGSLGSTYTGTGANLANLAAGTGGNIAGTYTGTGTNISNLLATNPMGQAAENIGQARASSYMGGAGALQGALSGIGQNAMLYALMGKQGGAPLGGVFGSPFPRSYSTSM